MIWRQLSEGKKVWLTGHSKGGGVATVAASRLLLGDSIDNRVLRDLLGSTRAGHTEGLSPRLSVLSFNSPMTLNKSLAAEYTTRLAEVNGEHLRFENKGDVIRSMPKVLFFKHVGESHEYGETSKAVEKVADVMTAAYGAAATGGVGGVAIGGFRWASRKVRNHGLRKPSPAEPSSNAP